MHPTKHSAHKSRTALIAIVNVHLLTATLSFVLRFLRLLLPLKFLTERLHTPDRIERSKATKGKDRYLTVAHMTLARTQRQPQ